MKIAKDSGEENKMGKYQTALISPVPESDIEGLINDFMAQAPHWDTMRDIMCVFATMIKVHYLDSVAAPLFEIGKLGDSWSAELGNDWSVKKIDLGNPWYKDFIFINSESGGFVMRMELDPVRSEENDAAQVNAKTRDDLVLSIISKLNEEEKVVKEGIVDENWRPDRSTRINEIWVHPFGSYCEYGTSADELSRTLAQGKWATNVIEYRPSEGHRYGTENWEYSSANNRVLYPQSAMLALGLIHKVLEVSDTEGLSDALRAHIDASYETLETDRRQLLIAAKSAIVADGGTLGAACDVAVQQIWKRGLERDLKSNQSMIAELADMLARGGNQGRDNQYDCNDGRTTVYVVSGEEKATLFVAYGDEDEAISYEISDDGIAAFKANYENSTIGDRLVDLNESYEGASVGFLVPYDEDIASSLNRTMMEISSAHCCYQEDFPDRVRNDGVISP